MVPTEMAVEFSLIAIPGLPAIAVLILGIARWATGRRAGERFVGAIVSAAFGFAALNCALLGAHLWLTGEAGIEGSGSDTTTSTGSCEAIDSLCPSRCSRQCSSV